MKELDAAKDDPLLDSIDLDYAGDACLIDSVDGEEGGSGGAGEGRDFLLGDMDLMFDGGGDSADFADAKPEGSKKGEKKKRAPRRRRSSKKNNSTTSANAPPAAISSSSGSSSSGSNSSLHQKNLPATGNSSNAISAQSQTQDLSSALFSDISKIEPRNSVSSVMTSDGSTDFPTNGTWRSESEDKHARQMMILEIARLLKSRKKTQPTKEWLQQLPHKARKLEERLYRTAPSMSAYQDMTTLKNRLRGVAQMITKHFKDRHFASANRRSTTSSASDTLTSLRNSLTSQSQQMVQRDSLVSQGSIGSLNQRLAGMASVGAGIPSTIGITNNNNSNQMAQNHRSSLSSLKAAPLINNGGAMAMNNISSMPTPPNNNGVPILNRSQSAPVQGNTNGVMSQADPKSLLEQQKALNEKLRREIEENIKKQNEWFKQMQEKQKGFNSGILSGGQQQSNNNIQAQAQHSMMTPSNSQTNMNVARNNSGNQASTGNQTNMANFQQGQIGNNMLGMQGMQQQMSAMQPNAAGMRSNSMGNMPNINQGNSNMNMNANSNNNQQNQAAQFQAAQMQALFQQQQAKNNGMTSQMQMNGMQGQLSQQLSQTQQPGMAQNQIMMQQQQQLTAQQQQMLNNMLRGPKVVPQTNGNMSQQSANVNGGSMPPPPVVPKQGNGGVSPLSPGSFNW